MGTIDGHMVAVDAKTGKLLWDKAVVRPEAGYAFASAPLVIKDKVIMGPAGGEFGIRGFLAAFDVATGNEAWRFNLVPGPGRARIRHVAGGLVENRRRLDLADRFLRSGVEPHLLGRWKSGARLERRQPRRRQPLQQQRGGARRRHRKTEMAFPVLAARRVRLRRRANPRARGCAMAGAAAQADVLRQSQRLLLRARSRNRAVSVRASRSSK